ncbi:unnamed protein product [Danaus chrysippus]|uniref:(African queen) hypothetical protein n=1 Tax=Danaus chrysippus TaxID=151541 RepID=A0A8J2QRV8_9NEOP|nr:unnamed protein product [Danaus chrysippus]
MTPLFVVLYIIYVTSTMTQGEKNINYCDNHQGNYDMKSILGTWHVVALVPATGFPRMRQILCYQMDISETDEAGLRWLVGRNFNNPSQEFIDKIKGTIIRQRYHSEKPFDIWSKAIRSVNGCFRQLLSLETNNTRIADAENLDTMMQLHLMEFNEEYGPILVQILWGRLISAVIYRRSPGISMDRLLPVHKFLTKLRGFQREPRICDSPTKAILPPTFQRP